MSATPSETPDVGYDNLMVHVFLFSVNLKGQRSLKKFSAIETKGSKISGSVFV